MAKQTFAIGQRVQYRSGGNWKPFGVVIDEQPPLTLNGAVLVGPKYRVRWESDAESDESGWLSSYDLQPASAGAR